MTSAGARPWINISPQHFPTRNLFYGADNSGYALGECDEDERTGATVCLVLVTAILTASSNDRKMSVSGQASLPTTLQTSIALCQRFAASLAPNAPFEVPQTGPTAPSPLVLLHAAVTTLRAQVTKLSLLAITAPFTPSAVATCLAPLNDSILTSLVTAALLTTP
jgi:hypothetical protein